MWKWGKDMWKWGKDMIPYTKGRPIFSPRNFFLTNRIPWNIPETNIIVSRETCVEHSWNILYIHFCVHCVRNGCVI